MVLLSCRGPGGQPSAPHRALKEQVTTLHCEGSKNGVGVTSFFNSLPPGSVATSLLITCVLSFKSRGLSTTKLLWLGGSLLFQS